MKIGLVLSKTPSFSETFFLSKIKGLQENGIEVCLFVQYANPEFKLCPVITAARTYLKNPIKQLFASVYVIFTLLPFPKRLKKFIALEKGLKRSWGQILKNIYNNAHILKADLQCLHFGFATMALQSENVASAINAKMAVSLRGFDMDVYPLKHPNIYKTLFNAVDRVHAISQHMINHGFDEGLARNKDYSIIYPAIDIERFPKKTSKNKNEIVTIGRLHWIKGLTYVLEALAILRSKEIDFKYYIIGSGPDYDELKFSIHDLDLQDNVFLLGQKSHKDTLKYLETAEIYIQYSNSEGFCNAVLEAQAMQCLCIVSDGGALPENLLHNKTGFVVPKRNPIELAKTLENALNIGQIEKNLLLESARFRVINDFNLEKQKQEFFEFYTL